MVQLLSLRYVACTYSFLPRFVYQCKDVHDTPEVGTGKRQPQTSQPLKIHVQALCLLFLPALLELRMGLSARRELPAEAGWGVHDAGASKNILWLPKKRRLLFVGCRTCPCFCALPIAGPSSCRKSNIKRACEHLCFSLTVEHFGQYEPLKECKATACSQQQQL